MTWMLHRTMVGLIRRMPLPIALICFRAYNKLLRLLGPEHHARTYFGARVYCDARDLDPEDDSPLRSLGAERIEGNRTPPFSRRRLRRYRRQHRLRHVARVHLVGDSAKSYRSKPHRRPSRSCRATWRSTGRPTSAPSTWLSPTSRRSSISTNPRTTTSAPPLRWRPGAAEHLRCRWKPCRSHKYSPARRGRGCD